MSKAIEWKNGNGKRRWQSITSAGNKLYTKNRGGYDCGTAWSSTGEGYTWNGDYYQLEPKLFRWKWQAERAVRKLEAEVRKHKWSEVKS